MFRAGQVSRARVSQIMRLLELAPTAQEQILTILPSRGRDALTERELREKLAQS